MIMLDTGSSLAVKGSIGTMICSLSYSKQSELLALSWHKITVYVSKEDLFSR